jgi:hypothetical protein
VIVIGLSGSRHDLRLHRLRLCAGAKMEPDGLLHHELLALMEIWLTGRSDDCTTMLQPLDKDMITDRIEGYFDSLLPNPTKASGARLSVRSLHHSTYDEITDGSRTDAFVSCGRRLSHDGIRVRFLGNRTGSTKEAAENRE